MRILLLMAVATASFSFIGTPVPASASDPACKPEAKWCAVMEGCEDPDKRLCGVISYANKGGYVASPVKLEARGTQPDAPIHPDCEGASAKFSADVDLGQGIEFVAPADCAYKLTVKIKAGTTKDRNLFLTPGCVIKTSTDGTTLSNKWHMNVSWADGKQPDNAPDHPVDSAGNKCGKQGSM